MKRKPKPAPAREEMLEVLQTQISTLRNSYTGPPPGGRGRWVITSPEIDREIEVLKVVKQIVRKAKL